MILRSTCLFFLALAVSRDYRLQLINIDIFTTHLEAVILLHQMKPLLTLLIMGSFIHVPDTTEALTILVDSGPFASVEEAGSAENAVDWWDDDYNDDRACTECFAAVELKRFLPRCTDIDINDIDIAEPNKLPREGDVIILGSRETNRLIKGTSPHDSLTIDTQESFRLLSEFQGNRTVIAIEGGGRTGVLYGAYALLEKLGVGFFGLGENGTVYPDSISLLPDSLDIVENPSFLTRGFHAWEDRGNEEFLLWMGRNRMNLWTAADSRYCLCKKLGMKFVDGGHTILLNFLNPAEEYPYNHPVFSGDEDKPADPYVAGIEYTGDTNGDGVLTYFEAHPEWYRLVNGKRSDNIKDEFGDNFCTSNHDASVELARNMIQCLIDGKWRYVDIVNFWMMDNIGHWCDCTNCQASGTYTDRLLAVIDIVSRELRKARDEGRLRRRVELSSLAYLDTLDPPTRQLPEDFDYENVSITYFPIERCYNHTLADPACTEINKRLAANYLAWTTGEGRYYTGAMFIGEYYNISYLKCLPMIYMRMMATDIPWYYATGSRHFHYMHTPTAHWGTWTLNQRMLSKLLWDVTLDSDAFLDDYFKRYYPSTCKITRTWYQHLETAMESFKALRYWGWKDPLLSGKGDLFPRKHVCLESQSHVTNDCVDIVDMLFHSTETQRLLDSAILHCADTAERIRLIEDKRRVDYGEAMIRFHYHLYRIAEFERIGAVGAAREEFANLKYVVDYLQSVTDIIQVASSHANADNGLEATQAKDVFDHFQTMYGQ